MTETKQDKVITEPSLIGTKRLAYARQVRVKSSGVVVKMSNDHVKVYMHLDDQFRGFTNPENIAAGKSSGHYYDSKDNLAARCNVGTTKLKEILKDFKALNLIDWKAPKAKKSGQACEYFVMKFKDVAQDLDFIYPDLPNGGPSYDHERISGKKLKQQQPEENNNGKSKEPNHADDVVPSKADAGESAPIQQLASDRGDDVSPDDEVSEEEDPVFPVSPKAKSVPEAGHQAKRRRSGLFAPTTVEDDLLGGAYERAEAEEFHRHSQQRENYH